MFLTKERLYRNKEVLFLQKMTKRLNEKKSNNPHSLKTIPVEMCFCTDDCLYDDKCFDNFNVNDGPKIRQKFFCCIPSNTEKFWCFCLKKKQVKI